MKRDFNKNNWRTWFSGLITGIAVLLLILLAVSTVKGGIHFIDGETMRYYKDLDKSYGKYYRMESLIRDEALDKEKVDVGSVLLPYLMSRLNDDYADYFTKEEYDDFERKYLKSYAGIGIIVQEREGKVYIVKIFEESPADREKIPLNAIITKVDGAEVHTANEASEKIRGKVGTKVEIECDVDGNIKKYTLKRANIDENKVTGKVYDEKAGIGYVKIPGFKNGTAKEMKSEIESLKKKGCKKIIIDLRENTGGVMTEGVDCADQLLPKSKIMIVKDSKGKKKTYNSDSNNLGVECVLAVDGETASASEIFAYALKDNGAAKLVGENTYGKGVIQGIYELGDGSKLKLTISEYFSPKGNKINGIGIAPDIKADAKGDSILEKCANVLRHK